MPVSMYPPSRREFLQQLGAVAAGSVLWTAQAATAPVDPNRWALLSDVHLAADSNMIHEGIHMAGNFTTATKAIAVFDPRPAGAIICGDCAVIQGEKGDYANIVTLSQTLLEAGIPIHWVMGNHDHRENFFSVFNDVVPENMDTLDRYARIIETPHADWYLLDSKHDRGIVPGLLGEKQCAWLAKQLDARPDRPALVLMHHYPAGKLGSDVNQLIDTDALLDVIVPRKQVKAWFYGHSHAWGHKEHEGIHLVNIPSLVWTFDPNQPRGWVDAHVKSDGIDLELTCLDPAHPKHGDKLILTWRG